MKGVVGKAIRKTMKTKGRQNGPKHRARRKDRDVGDTPTTRYFAERVWICLIAKELMFFATTRSPQECEKTWFLVLIRDQRRGGEVQRD